MPDEWEPPRCRAFDDGYGRKDKSKKQEKRIAKNLGGHVQPASGAIEGIKGDVKLEDFLVEAKRTDAKSISIQADWLVKIVAEAAATSRSPALSIEIGGHSMLPEKDWVLIPASVFQELLGRKGR